jgi:hypothetical protein
VLAATLGAGAGLAADPAGVYGYVNKVILEPNAENPRRVQVWGTFSVAAPAPADAYQVPENGFLYLEFPADSAAARKECSDLENVIGKLGVVAFAGRGVPPRVRTSDQPPAHPDPYTFGNGVALVPWGTDSAPVQALGRLPKASGQIGYALVDKVVLEPDDSAPERIQVWGVFALSEPSGNPSAPAPRYAAPRPGYLYLKLPPDRPATAWGGWKPGPGDRQVVKFHTHPNLYLRVRDAAEMPDAPDAFGMSGPEPVRPDTEYAPVKALLTMRNP